MGTRALELQLLLDCLKVATQIHSTPKVQIQIDQVNWDHFHRLASHHQVLSLIYTVLKSHYGSHLPEALINQIQTDIQKATQKRLWLAVELVRICKSFQDQEIAALSFKGPLLSKQLYGDLLMRHQGDLDLLVDRKDYLGAKLCLQELGYTLIYPQASQWTSEQEQTFLSLHGQINFYRLNPESIVDLHIRWFRNPHAFPLEFSQALSARNQISIQGYPLSVPKPIHTLLFLCVHGAKHRWEKLFWLIDIIKWFQYHPDLDWSELFQEAERFQCQRSLVQALLLADQLLEMSLPQRVSQYSQQDRVMTWLVEQITTYLDQESYADHEYGSDSSNLLTLPSELWSELYYMTRLQTNIPYKLACLSHLKTSIRDWELLPLPASLAMLYYPLRPILYLSRMVQSWQKKQQK